MKSVPMTVRYLTKIEIYQFLGYKIGIDLFLIIITYFKVNRLPLCVASVPF